MILSKHIFSFTKYVQPGWYFSLPAPEGTRYWVDVRKISAEDRQYLDLDPAFEHENSALRDAAHQLLLKGYISAGKDLSLVLSDDAIPIADEYRFLRRNYHAWWSWYVFFLRCLSLYNPLREWSAFARTRSVTRKNVYARVFPHVVNMETNRHEAFVSVIIPTLNRYSYLRNILQDLERQTFKKFDVWVIDQSHPYRPEFYDAFNLSLKVIRQDEPGLWKARNKGVCESQAEWIAFSEDDVRVKENWLENHVACVSHFNVDVSAGIFFPEGAELPVHKSHFRWSEQFATGNAFVNRSVFKRVGLFDLQFERMRMGDGEFGLRCYCAGIRSISNPMAYALDVKAPQGGLRQMGSWDSFRPTSLFSPRPVPSVLYLIRRYFGNGVALYDLLVKIPMSIIPFRFKRDSRLYWIGGLLALVLLPFVCIQVFRSWRKSSRMLLEGPKIEKLTA
jgi:glycosyltransferase involved in cell wall biosynthesis